MVVAEVLSHKSFQNQLAEETEALARSVAAKQRGMRAFISTRSKRWESVVMVGAGRRWDAVIKCVQGDHEARAAAYVAKYNAEASKEDNC